jgi:predicted GNAT superfamily acetyltransferase
MQYTIRQLETGEEYKACLQLQKETWGENFSECVPPSILLVGQKIGGVSAGAFDKDGTLIGFVFSLVGVKDGKLVHWSDMLAVKPYARDAGLGMKLKLFQREHCLQIGAETIYWTYDPLEAKNAHLNINKLGANIDEYVADMYVSSDSILHQGLAMDRFVVAWHIASNRVDVALTGRRDIQKEAYRQAPVVNTESRQNGELVPVENEFSTARIVRVEIPENIQQVKVEAVDRAIQWRANTRKAFRFYQQRGYEIDGFYREKESGRCFYVLMKNQL